MSAQHDMFWPLSPAGCLYACIYSMSAAVHACLGECVKDLSLSVCLCVRVCVCWPLLPSLLHPSFESVCDIQSSNCQVWPPHSSPRPAYQRRVTLTTANYHRNGDLGFTVALWAYRYISFNKLPLPNAQPHTLTHTHTHTTTCLQPSPLLSHIYCYLTDIFTAILLRLPQDRTVFAAPNEA